MKNYKKIIILTVLFVSIAGFAFSSVNSVDAAKTYKTGKMYFKEDKYYPTSTLNKRIDKNNLITGHYVYPRAKGVMGTPNTLDLGIVGRDLDTPSNYKATKIIIKFKKKVNNKMYYSTKTFKKSYVQYKPKNNYKPYYSVVYYKKIR